MYHLLFSTTRKGTPLGGNLTLRKLLRQNSELLLATISREDGLVSRGTIQVYL